MAKKDTTNTSKHIDLNNPTVGRDDLADLLASELNKASKDKGKIAYFLDEKEDPSTVTDWVSTGSTMLDLAISNRPYGGLPVGRITTLTGLEGCVTEDTIIEVIIDREIFTKKITVGEVKNLLESGKSVKVKTINGEFTPISRFVEKGILDTYEVILQKNGVNKIKVSREHKFFTDVGWLETKDLIPNKNSILCEDGKYYTIISVNLIGKYRIVDITVDHPEHCYFGNEMLNHNTGKSLICAHIVANTQKKGGQAVYIDTEAAAAPEFWTALGVDLKKMLYISQDTIEGACQNVEDIIGIIRKSDSDRLCTIIVDSIAGASTKIELEQGYERKGYATTKALIVSEAMRKLTNLVAKRRILLVFTNQLRQNLQAMAFGDKWCVDPFTTKIKIRYKNKYIEEEISIAEFAERFLGINEFNSEIVKSIDISELDVEVLGKNLETGKDEYNKLNKFLIKPTVKEYYTDGRLNGTDMHRIIEDGKEIHLKDHPDFHRENGEMKVVDFEVEKTHNYYANGRLNHNTEPCGKATSFHSSVKVRFETIEKLKNSDKEIIGVHTKATVRKNRLGPPFKSAEFEVYFDSGIADYASWVELAKKKKIITPKGAWLEYNGENFNTDSLVKVLNENEPFKNKLYTQICDSVIMQYKSPNSSIKENLIAEPENAESPDVIEAE